MTDEWITARQAIKIVAPNGDPHGDGVRSLCGRAHSGLILAKAELLRITRGSKIENEQDAEIPSEFWWAKGARALEQDWERSEFSTWIDGRVLLEAFGVSFSRSGVEKIAQREAEAAAPSRASEAPISNKGGSPGKYDWARAAAAIVFDWVDNGSWHPSSQKEVQEKLSDWFSRKSQNPDDKLLKSHAKWLFSEFQKRNLETE